MVHSQMESVIAYIRGLAAPPGTAEQGDSALLGAFAASNDQGAFTTLVKRHGPLVLSVCRRVLQQEQQAEDAFQATFLLLAKKAASLKQGASLAGWLHEVAYRVANNARRAAVRRQRQEKRGRTMQTSRPEIEVVWREVHMILDEEVQRLPAIYRDSFVLTCLENRSGAEAARLLGVNEGTLGSRLSKARALLRKSLARRGLAPHAILFAPLAAAMLPQELLARTVALTPQGAVIPPAVATLVKGMTTALGSTSRYVVGALVTAVALAVGASATRGPQRAETPPQPAEPKKESKSASAPLPEGAIARIGSPRLRHAGEVVAVAFSTDRRWLASASADDNDRSVRVWDLTDGAEKLRVPIEVNSNGTPAPHRAVAVGFSKNGELLRVIDFVSYRVIDRATGRQLLQHRFYEKAPPQGWDSSNVIGAAFSPDLNTYAVVRTKGELVLADAATGKARRTIAKGVANQENRSYAWVSVVFSSDGRRVCIPVESDAVKVFDTASGDVMSKLSLKQCSFGASAFLKGGEEFAYLTQDGGKDVVEVVNVADGKKVRQFPVEATAKCLDASPDGKYLAVANLQRWCIQLLDPFTGKEIRRIPRSFSEARVIFSPDSKLLASIAFWSGSVMVWETASGKRLPSSADGVEHLRGFDRDGRLVVCVDARYQITDWRTGRVFGDLPIRHGPYHTNVNYSPDHRLKAYHDMMKLEDWKPEKGFPITVRDVATDKEISRLIGNSDYCQQMVFTNDSKRLVTASQDAVIRLWDIAAGKQLWAEKQPVRIGYVGAGDPHLSADDRRLAVLCQRSDKEMELRVWDLVTKKRVAEIPVPYLFFGGIDFSQDGRFIAGGGNDRKVDPNDKGTVFVWDVDTGKVYQKLAGHSPGNITCRFAPDGRTLSTVDDTGVIRIWELPTGQERLRITGHRGRTFAYFSSDSALIAGCSNEAPVLIWDVYGHSKASESFDPEKAWQTLGDENAARSFTAMRRLCAAPERTVKLLGEKLKPVEKVEAKTIHKWIRELDDDDFRTREAAQKSLEKLGDRAARSLRDALRQSPSAETRTRVNRLLEALDILTPDQLRQQRAVEVLERIGSAEAKSILAELAQGADGARLTLEAAASLARWKQR
ncbi:MAG TPA: sigma-70 family RNA polymerase sigma factor [Gemmataceae bacterium]|nr:sigma-70 family RNA polymerase sigma factor [Gemmataceae bacterium]